jgi:DNA repair exonuclease SbcCD ATPase subunit
MKPIALRITNFRSFRKTQEFIFPQVPGLFFLWGENREEPRLEANGSGKSSLWEALHWLFFGTTSRGLKAGDIASWDVGKGTVVEFEFSVNGTAHTARRTWSPNTWMLHSEHGDVQDLAKDETNELMAMLRLSQPAFLSSVLIAQGQPMFLDLKSQAKATLFADVMGLDRWLDYSQRAAVLGREEDIAARALESRLANYGGQLESLERSDISQLVKQWDEDQDFKLARLKKEYNLALDTLAILKEKVTKAEALYDKAAAVLGEAIENMPPGSTCKTCGQAMPDPDAHLRDEVQRKMEDCQRGIRAAVRDVELQEKTLDAMEDRYDALLAEVNPHKASEDRRQEDLVHVKAKLKELQAELDERLFKYSLHSSWVKWFKEIRLSRISTALTQLEIEVNSCLSSLGLPDWELRFDVDRETKSGTVQRGFTVTVLSPHNEAPVPWEAWSGGESQRLRCAASMGLANLIRAQTGATLNLEVWDEPTQWMSGQGVADLLDALATRAKEEKRQIWVVDHRTLGYAGFDGKAGVVKGTRGSRFVFDSV